MSSASEAPANNVDQEVDPYLKMVLAAQDFLKSHQRTMVGELGARTNYITGADPMVVDTRLDDDLKPLFDGGQHQLAVSLQTLREFRRLSAALEELGRVRADEQVTNVSTPD